MDWGKKWGVISFQLIPDFTVRFEQFSLCVSRTVPVVLPAARGHWNTSIRMCVCVCVLAWTERFHQTNAVVESRIRNWKKERKATEGRRKHSSGSNKWRGWIWVSHLTASQCWISTEIWLEEKRLRRTGCIWLDAFWAVEGENNLRIIFPHSSVLSSSKASRIIQ